MLPRQLSYAVLGFAACFLSSLATPWAAEQASQSEAQQLAVKAAALVKEKGVEAARTAFDTDGEFKHGEIYVNVISDKGVRLVYPPAPAGENIDAFEAQDVDGKYLIKDILELARTKGEGWTQYRWANPVTKKIGEKITYVKSVPERGVGNCSPG
jgi:signal transduction histidine kinase